MKPEHINQARDAISARAVLGNDSGGLPEAISEESEDIRREYIKTSLDPHCGWAATLDEIERLKREAIRLREELNDAHDHSDRLLAKIDDMSTSI